MKTLKTLGCLFLLLSFRNTSVAQAPNANTMLISIDEVEFKTQPRRITMGSAGYITGNTVKPDKSLRFWFGNFNGKMITEPGKYLIVNADKPDTKDNYNRAQSSGQFRGIATVKYSQETREPRMEYHVGISGNNEEYIEVKQVADGYIEFVIEKCTLEGSYWKEKGSATAFGGLSRLKDKMESKIITQATGFDIGMDPEGNGYRRQDKTDKIILKNGSVKLKAE